KVLMKDLGIGYPVLMTGGIPEPDPIPLPGFGDSSNSRRGGTDAGQPTVTALRYDFTVQLCWKETPSSARFEKSNPPASDKPSTASATPDAAAPGQRRPL
ncbi:MAG TPA: hypothetical protein VG056_07695, partial [Pirellulales bacterium]|nr:hypothetical protein [Pirellulales bacterium]